MDDRGKEEEHGRERYQADCRVAGEQEDARYVVVHYILSPQPVDWMSDDPTLDSRLSFIRRQSGLDSRAALFVLSPVSAAELSEFIKRYRNYHFYELIV